MKIAINSGLGDMVHFLPFAVELSKKGPFEIVGNKYSAYVCALAGLENVTHDLTHTVMNPPQGATVARILRYGNAGLWWQRTHEIGRIADELSALGQADDANTMRNAAYAVAKRATCEAEHAKTYRQIYAEATGCDGSKAGAWQALGIIPTDSDILLFDMPRPSGLGSRLHTPNMADYSKELLKVADKHKQIAPLTEQPSLRDLFGLVARVGGGLGQIGFLTALCQLFEKPFYPVRGNNEPDENFLARCRVVHL